MEAKIAKVGMKVKSKINILDLTYTIEKVFKTVCWLSTDEYLYKGVEYSILTPAN